MDDINKVSYEEFMKKLEEGTRVHRWRSSVCFDDGKPSLRYQCVDCEHEVISWGFYARSRMRCRKGLAEKCRMIHPNIVWVDTTGKPKDARRIYELMLETLADKAELSDELSDRDTFIIESSFIEEDNVALFCKTAMVIKQTMRDRKKFKNVTDVLTSRAFTAFTKLTC